MKKNEITQATMLQWFLPLLREEGKLFRKTQQVLARKAVEGERIATITKDGLETTNVADADDYIVRNLTDSGEEYIVDTEAFKEKYQLVKDLDNEFDQYKPVSQIVALELTEDLLANMNLPGEFHFIAPWEEPMRAREGDFLVSPLDFSEIYRIARHEFNQTYKLV